MFVGSSSSSSDALSDFSCAGTVAGLSMVHLLCYDVSGEGQIVTQHEPAIRAPGLVKAESCMIPRALPSMRLRLRLSFLEHALIVLPFVTFLFI